MDVISIKCPLTLFGQTSALPQAGFSVHQFTLGTCGRCRASLEHVPIVTEGVAPAGIPGGVLPQLPLGLRFEASFLDAGRRHAAAVDLGDGLTGDGPFPVAFFSR